MAEQQSERLARLKREHSLWSIRSVVTRLGWTAHRGDVRLWAASLNDLETQLCDVDHTRGKRR